MALGGSLHQLVHEQPGLMDHREPKDAPRRLQYAAAHGVKLAEGGLLAKLLGASVALVNSIHAQGIDRLAPGLAVEATAPDGLIEPFGSSEPRSRWGSNGTPNGASARTGSRPPSSPRSALPRTPMPVGRSGPLPREDVAADDLLTIQDIGPDRLAQGGLVARPDCPYRRLVPVDDISGS